MTRVVPPRPVPGAPGVPAVPAPSRIARETPRTDRPGSTMTWAAPRPDIEDKDSE
ncbi:hypothetical protein [Streptomyces sp. NPDC048659]|uniref:hypothetical protein n=1 Tax=Streptomyces sp. NPDC048659 TaxID=3155489 RepID=UPI00342711E6